MLSRVGDMFRKLRCGGTKRTLSLPATTEETNSSAPPRAIHFTDMRESLKRSPTSPRPRPVGYQTLSIMVANAKGATSYQWLFKLLEREKESGLEFDPYGEYDTTFSCNDYTYDVEFLPFMAPGPGSAYLCLLQHICLVLPYDASSRESWDEMSAAYERMRSRCLAGALPFLATMIAAMGVGQGPRAVSHEEGEAFASQRGCLYAEYSPTTGRGLCNAVGSLVELAYGARDQFPAQPSGLRSNEPSSSRADQEKFFKRAEAIQGLFAE